MLIIFITAGITALLLLLEPFQNLFQFEKLTGWQVVTGVSTGFISVIWFEIVKYFKRRKSVQV